MGDRGNIAVLQHGDTPEKPNQVWFYSHWSGTELPDVLKLALGRRQRWKDDGYLARIIFCEMVKGQKAEETGFGIYTSIGDNEHDITVCDIPNQRVYAITENELENGRVPDGWKPKEPAMTFEEFVTSKPEAVET